MANEPITPSANASTTAAPAGVFRTYAKDLAALGGRAAQVVPPKRVEPVAPAVATPAPSPVRPQPEPPPARIIPKAPSTDESREAVLARLRQKIAAEAASPTPQPLPEMPAGTVVPKAPSTDESREAVLNRLRKNAASVNRLETPPPVSAPAQKPLPPAAPVPEAPAPIHTYKTDFADHIDAKKASTFSVLAAQADTGQAPAARIKERGTFPVALVAGLVLIVAGGGALFYAFNVVNQEPVIPYVSTVPSLIFADESIKLSGEGPELMNAVSDAAAMPLASGHVRVTYTALATTSPEGMPIDTPLPGGALIAALRLPAPEILIRNVEPQSTAGIVNAGADSRAFFILKVSSYERTFAGMLEWEPRMLADLELLYPPYANESAGTSTPAVTALPSFSDEIVSNRDVRVLRDSVGRSLILYGYRDKETLIVARDEAAFAELLERLSTSREQ